MKNKLQQLKKLEIDQCLFDMAFNRDFDFHDICPQTTYLDEHSGETLFVCDDDNDAEWDYGIPPEENRALREKITATPKRYLDIPGLSHGEHHELLREFLNSNWTESDSMRDFARSQYFGSIGGWKEAVDNQDIIHAFYSFREERMRQMAEEFLREHGIEPTWR